MRLLLEYIFVYILYFKGSKYVLENRRNIYMFGGFRKIQSMHTLCMSTSDLYGIPVFLKVSVSLSICKYLTLQPVGGDEGEYINIQEKR